MADTLERKDRIEVKKRKGDDNEGLIVASLCRAMPWEAWKIYVGVLVLVTLDGEISFVGIVWSLLLCRTQL